MTTRLNWILLLAVVLSTTATRAQDVPPVPQKSAAEWTAVLESDASREDKATACRELGRLGTKDAVPALAALLADPELSHMARYGLEPIPDPSVDDALRAALGKLKGLPLVGVIGSIGVRHDVQAVGALAGLLGDADPVVARAAARALGSIGTPEAAKALSDLLPTAPAANRLAVCEGLFRAAECAAAQGQKAQAVAIYDRLAALDGPYQVRYGALRASIGLQGGAAGLAVVRKYLHGPDYVLFTAAVRATKDLPGTEVVQVLNSELNSLDADRKIVVMQTLACRGDHAALPALTTAAKTGDKPVRLAAIGALLEIGDASVAPLLFQLLEDPDRDLAQAAQEGLAALAGPAIDTTVMAMLGGTQTPQRLKALELIGQRRMRSAMPTLLKTAGDADQAVRLAALRTLGELGGAEQIPALVDRFMAAPSAQDLNAAQEALGAICTRMENPEPYTEQLAGLMPKATPEQKIALLGVQATVGGANALKAVRAALADPDATVHRAAIRTLSVWKTTDALADLWALAENVGKPTDRMLALRGYLGWAGRSQLPPAERLDICRKAQKLVQKPEEKRLLLAALGSVGSPASLAMIAPYLNDPTTRDEAVAASVATAQRVLGSRKTAGAAPKLIVPLEKVVATPANPALIRRAQEVLSQARAKAAGK
jgi:HEAT repeat protein